MTLLYACTAERPAYNRENLKATWLVNVYDGDTVDARLWTIYTFDDKQTLTIAGVSTDTEGNNRWETSTMSYSAYCCDLHINGTLNGFFGIPISYKLKQNFSFIDSQDSLCILELMTNQINGEDVAKTYNRVTMTKLPKGYGEPDSLLGIWQTQFRDGEKFDICRLKFEKSNKFTFSVQDSSGLWIPSGDGKDKYYLYSDFAVLDLYDNEYLGTEGKYDVACMTDIIASPKSLSLMSFQSNGSRYMCTLVAEVE